MKKVWIAKISSSSNRIACKQCLPDSCTAHRNMLQHMFRNFFNGKLMVFCHLLEQMIIALSITAKFMIVTNDNGVRPKVSNQEIAHILPGSLAGKSRIKGYHHNMCDATILE